MIDTPTEENMTQDELRRLYARWLHELWTSADQEVAQQLVAPDFVGHWPHRDVHGPAELVAVIAQSLAMFSGVTTTIDVGPLVDGDLVSARWTFHGAYAGGMPGVAAPVGTPIALRGADVLRAADGRFVEYWVSSDADQLAAQLGQSGDVRDQ